MSKKEGMGEKKQLIKYYNTLLSWGRMVRQIENWTVSEKQESMRV
jgi:hypothetical protein